MKYPPQQHGADHIWYILGQKVSRCLVIGLGLVVGIYCDWNLGSVKNSVHDLLQCESDPFIFHYFAKIDMPTQIGSMIDQEIKERKTSTFIQRFWRLTSVLVVTEGNNELVKNNTDRGIIGVFIEEFDGSDFVGDELALGMGMSCSIIKSVYCKSLSTSICDESLPIWIPLAKPFEGVPELVTVACRNVQIQDIEGVSIV